MENVWTDRKELDRITDIFEDEYNQLKETIISIKAKAPNYSIGNLGLYSGNKMRSLYKRYKEKNVDYSKSCVNRAIEKYLVYLFDCSVYALNSFSHRFNNIPENERKRDAQKIITSSIELREYKKICDEAYDFNIDEDVVVAIEYTLDNTIVNNLKTMNTLIDFYNEELEKLGISQKIEYRTEEDIIEISEKELLANSIMMAEVLRMLVNKEYNEVEEKNPQKKKNKE